MFKWTAHGSWLLMDASWEPAKKSNLFCPLGQYLTDYDEIVYLDYVFAAADTGMREKGV